MFSSKRPSQIREGFYQDPSHHPCTDYTSLVQRYIIEETGSNNRFGPGTFLYVCLVALLELHLSSAPTCIPHIGANGVEELMCLRYRDSFNPHNRECIFFHAPPGIVWNRLKTELDEQRTTLRWMTRFFQKHFDYKNQDLRTEFEEIRERFRLRVEDLEQAESQLRDSWAWEGIDKGYRMAEMSIRESKRVMLRT
jgi:hypothetical protein